MLYSRSDPNPTWYLICRMQSQSWTLKYCAVIELSSAVPGSRGDRTLNCTRTTYTRTLHQDILPLFPRLPAIYRHFLAVLVLSKCKT